MTSKQIISRIRNELLLIEKEKERDGLVIKNLSINDLFRLLHLVPRQCPIWLSHKDKFISLNYTTYVSNNAFLCLTFSSDESRVTAGDFYDCLVSLFPVRGTAKDCNGNEIKLGKSAPVWFSQVGELGYPVMSFKYNIEKHGLELVLGDKEIS